MMAFAFLEYVFLCSAISLNAVVESHTDSIIYPTKYDDLLGTHIIYTFFTTKRSWNEARAVCTSIGGDLAKVPSVEDISTMSKDEDVKKFFNTHYFSSAVRLTEDQYLWMSDCTNGTISISSRFNEFKESDTHPACVEVHHDGKKGDHFHVVTCNSHKAPFLCETKTRTPCNLVKVLDTDVIKLDNMTESDCNELCNGDVTCWAAITTPTHCIKATIPGYGLSTLSMSTKQCTGTPEVHVNKSSFVLPPQLSTSALQETTPPDCVIDNVKGTTPPLPTLTTPAPPTDIISTKIVTSAQCSTIFVTSTKYVVDPTPQITDTDQKTLTVTTTITPRIDTDSVTFTKMVTSPLPTLTSPAPPKDIISTKIVTATQFSTIFATSTQFSTIFATSAQFSTIFVTSTKYVVDPTPQITDTDQKTLTVTTTVTPRIDTDSVTFTTTSVVNYTTYLVTINPKNTSLYRRSVTSASDTRKTSLVIGISCVTLVIIPLWIMILSDLKTIIRHFFNHETIYAKKKSGSKIRPDTATT